MTTTAHLVREDDKFFHYTEYFNGKSVMGGRCGLGQKQRGYCRVSLLDDSNEYNRSIKITTGSEEEARAIVTLYVETGEIATTIDLTTVPTRQLLNWLRHSYRTGGPDFNPIDSGNERTWVSVAAMKRELATREHVPNKPEAKQRRQARARKGRN